MAKRSRGRPRPCLGFAPWLPAPAGSAVLRGKGKGLPARPSKGNPRHSQEGKDERQGMASVQVGHPRAGGQYPSPPPRDVSWSASRQGPLRAGVGSGEAALVLEGLPPTNSASLQLAHPPASCPGGRGGTGTPLCPTLPP